jgi:CBS domain containing-hemolysin-like protein
MTLGLAAAIVLACVVVQGFFSGSEIALVSSDRIRLQAAAKAGHRGAAVALELLQNPARMLGTCLLGTNLSLITATTVATAAVTEQLQLPATAAALFVVPLTLTLGEMVPKAVYQHHADRVAPVVAGPLRLVAWLAAPALFVLERASRVIGHADEGQGMAREELRLLLDGAQVAADISPTDRQLLQRVLTFSEASVEDLMVPLIDTIGVPEDAPLAESARRMTESGHSRLPVYRGRVDRIVGIVLHQDLLAAPDWAAPTSAVARAPLFVPETKKADQLLVDMRRNRQRMAVAVDEYGGAVGIITIEDLVEEIVGQIEDESDRGTPHVRRVGEREWVAAGRAERDAIEAATGLQLPEGDFETIAGFLLSALGRVPLTGEQYTEGRYLLTVQKASERAILEVRVRRER